MTSLLARSLRGDDRLGSSDPAGFAVVLSGSATAAERPTLSQTSARRVGAGTVIRYREPLA